MAVDQVLLETAVSGGPNSLRFYFWREPTLSIGYFQAPPATWADSRWARLPFVQRLSGGGAILHDRDLTYCCALTREHPLSRQPLQAYDAVHEAFSRVLERLGFGLQPRGTRDASKDSEPLCFGRADAFDLVMRGRKVLGSAQRRRKGALLQHGSLLLRGSTWAPEFPGLFDLAGREVDTAHLLELLAQAVSGALAAQVVQASLTPHELRRAQELVAADHQTAG